MGDVCKKSVLEDERRRRKKDDKFLANSTNYTVVYDLLTWKLYRKKRKKEMKMK